MSTDKLPAEVRNVAEKAVSAIEGEFRDWLIGEERNQAIALVGATIAPLWTKMKESHDFSNEWWATRSQTLSDWVRNNRDKLSPEFVQQYFSIVANGTPDIVGDSGIPNYARLLNQQKHRANAAESDCNRLRADLGREQEAHDKTKTRLELAMRWHLVALRLLVNARRFMLSPPSQIEVNSWVRETDAHFAEVKTPQPEDENRPGSETPAGTESVPAQNGGGA